MVILDSTLVVDFLRDHKDAIDTIRNLEARQIPFSIGSPTVMEIVRGLYLRTPRSGEIENANRFFESIQIFSFDENAARQSGRIEAILEKMGRIIDVEDIQIAGIALSRGEGIITRNVEHFSRISGLKIESY